MARRRRAPAAAAPPFDAPLSVLRCILQALPADTRARCACVCRTWRDVAADPALWQALVLRGCDIFSEALLRGAAARAAGQLRVLNLHGYVIPGVGPAVDQIVAANADALRELHLCSTGHTVESLRAHLASAPQLQLFAAPLFDDAGVMCPALRNEPPFAPLRAPAATLSFCGTTQAAALDAAAALATHAALKQLTLRFVRYADPAVISALLDAASAQCSVTFCSFRLCSFYAENMPALARLLGRGALEILELRICAGFPPTDEQAVAQLAAALRSSESLTQLRLKLSKWDAENHNAIAALLEAVAEMPRLGRLEICDTDVAPGHKAAAGRAIGAMLAADPTALRALAVSGCKLGDGGMGPLLDGLSANTRLCFLECDDNALRKDFVRRKLRPALRVLAARTGQ